MKKIFKFILDLFNKRGEIQEAPRCLYNNASDKFPCSMIGRKVKFFAGGSLEEHEGIIVCDYLIDDELKSRTFNILLSSGKIINRIPEKDVYNLVGIDYEQITSARGDLIDTLKNIRLYCSEQCIVECDESCVLYKFKSKEK